MLCFTHVTIPSLRKNNEAVMDIKGGTVDLKLEQNQMKGILGCIAINLAGSLAGNMAGCLIFIMMGSFVIILMGSLLIILMGCLVVILMGC